MQKSYLNLCWISTGKKRRKNELKKNEIRRKMIKNRGKARFIIVDIFMHHQKKLGKLLNSKTNLWVQFIVS